MESLDSAKEVLRHVCAEFIEHFDVAAIAYHLYSKELIDESMMEVILNAKSKKDANRTFLSHLRSNATIESLEKLCKLLRGTARDHQRHDSLAKSLEDELKQSKRGGRGEDGPSSSQSSTSELSNKVFSEEDAASRLGIVAALDLSKGTSQPIVLADAYLAKDPPHRKVETAFFRLRSRLAEIFNLHIDDLKPFLCACQTKKEWPYKQLEVEDIEAANNIRTIFNKMSIEKCWLNTVIFIRLIDVLPDKKSREAKQHLEVYHKLLGVFSKYVLLSHIPKDDARLEHFYSRLFPKLRVTYDVNMEDFDVSKMFKEQKFLSKFFEIPEEAFHYLEAKPSSTLVTWALAISMEKAFKLFQRVTHVFWNLKEHLIIKVEIESDGILQLLNHLKGRNLLYQIKKTLQGNQDLLACTEHVSRQFLALVDYSHLQRKGTENEKMMSFIEKPVVKTKLSPYLDIKTEPTSPDVSLEPSSKRFKTETDYLAYEQLLKKKSEKEHSLLSSLAEYKTLNEDLRTKVQQMEKDLSLKEEELRVVEGELKVSRKEKGKAVTPDREIEEKVSFKEESVVKTKLSPDVKSEPSSKRFKAAGPEYLTYEPPLEKKAEEKLFHSDLVRPGELHSVKMPDLLIPTYHATPVTIGRDVYLAGGITGQVKTVQLVQIYNLDSGDCRTLPPSPQYLNATVAIDGTLVLIGGCDSSTHKTTMVTTWMAAEERWTQALPPMKMKRLRPGVLLLKSHLFVFGGVGEDEKTRLDSFEVLDLNTKQWSEGRGGLPQPLSTPQLGVFGDYVMLYGGFISAARKTRACYTVPVQVLVDSVINPLSPPIHWTPVQGAPYFCSTLLTTSQDAVLIGGDSMDDQVTRAIHRFSSSGSWKVIGELSEPRARPTVVAVSNRSFLVLGGVSDVNKPSSSLLKSVELISCRS